MTRPLYPQKVSSKEPFVGKGMQIGSSLESDETQDNCKISFFIGLHFQTYQGFLGHLNQRDEVDNSSDAMSVFGKNLIFLEICLRFFKNAQFFSHRLAFYCNLPFSCKKDQSSFFTKYILDVIFDYFYLIFCLFSSVFR